MVGGNGPFEPRLLGIADLKELPQGLYGSARASALATGSSKDNNALIVADLSNDATYAEALFETFGRRGSGSTSPAMAMACKRSGGRSSKARSSSTRSAAPICSSCFIPTAGRIWSGWSMGR